MKSLQKLVNELNNIDSDLVDGEIFEEILTATAGDSDFCIETSGAEYRFIGAYEIDEIQRDELSWDEYILGCFNASFLANLDNMPLDYDSIKAIQDSEAFEALGKIILNIPDLLEEIQQDYARYDGYGHHFAHYDNNEHEITINGNLFYVFRTN